MKNKKINSKFMTDHTQFMRAALDEAEKARELDEIPIGAVVTLNDEIKTNIKTNCFTFFLIIC